MEQTLTVKKTLKFKIVEMKPNDHSGRCINCAANQYCGRSIKFKCMCEMKQQYELIQVSDEF
jgi:hypothetical protein